MDTPPDEAKNARAEFALKQLQQRVDLLQQVKKGCYPTEFAVFVFMSLLAGALCWLDRHQWRPMDTGLLILISSAMSYEPLSMRKRMDALIKLLELEDLLKPVEGPAKSSSPQ